MDNNDKLYKKYKGYTVVYKFVNPIGQVYIGATSNLQGRFIAHKNFNPASKKLLVQSFIKYGFQNHVLHILWKGKCNEEEKFKKESFYIKKENSCVLDNPDYGLNAKRSNEDNEYSKYIMPHMKKVYKYNILDGKYMDEYNSIHEAASLNTFKDGAYKNISACCLGKRRYAYKFYWSFVKSNYYKPEKSWKNKKEQEIIKLKDGVVVDTFTSISEAASKNNVSSLEMFRIIQFKRLLEGQFTFIKPIGNGKNKITRTKRSIRTSVHT